MIRDFETLVSVSQQHIDNIEYDKLVVESKDSILSILNPQFAKEKEQEVRFTSLESRVGGVEKGINDIKSLLVEALNKKGWVMYMIEIKEDDISNVITNVGKSIRCMNKVLECLENIKDKSNRTIGYDDDDDDEEDDDEYGTRDRHNRHKKGRYGRY